MDEKREMKLVIVIPALNEEKNIAAVVENIPRKMEGVSELRIVVVNDGSTDNTSKVANDVGAEVIEHPYHLGLGAAFDTGLQFALDHNFDLMVTIDGDGQFDPQDIKKIVKPILAGKADFVTASRFVSKKFRPEMPLIKLWGNKLVSALVSRLTRKRFFDVSCGFRAYSQKAMLSLNLLGGFTYTHEVFLDLAFRNLRISEIPVKVRYFPSRRSRIASKLLSYGVNTLKIVFRAYRDYRPLRFFFGVGGLFLVTAAFFGSILLWTFVNTGEFRPNIWSGFVGAAFFFVAIVFFCHRGFGGYEYQDTA